MVVLDDPAAHSILGNMLALTPLLAGLITLAALQILLVSPLARQVVDQANHRSMHVGVIPRIGGLCMLIGLTVAFAILAIDAQPALRAAMLGYLAISLLSLADDVRPLGAGLRLIVQLAICTVWTGLALAYQTLPWSWWWLPLLAVGATWASNLYNFMDGANGLAGSMALTGFSALALAAALAGDRHLALLCASLAAAAVAFLRYNWDPAKVFMGDSGSVPLGFSAAVLGLYGVGLSLWSPAFALLCFAPFGFDATLTLLRRARRGERLSEAHREHIYQKAVRSGIGHLGMTMRAVVLMVICIGLGFSVRAPQSSWLAQTLALGIALLLMAWVAVWVERRFRSHEEKRKSAGV